MRHSMATCWALNGVAERAGSKVVTVDATQFKAMSAIFEGTRYTVRIIDAVDPTEIRSALDWALTHTDFTTFSKFEILGAIAFNDRRLMAHVKRLERPRFSSSHDPRTCPTIRALRNTHFSNDSTVACPE